MRKTATALLVIIVLSCGCASRDEMMIELSDKQSTETVPAKEKSVSSKESENNEAPVCVYVCGHVMSPGVYQLMDGSRVCDAINAAGGPSEDADAQMLNQAAAVTDGMRIYVPSAEETKGMDRSDQSESGLLNGNTAVGEKGGKDSARINLNTATKEQLMTLSGIGESKAQSILDYRQEKGKFSRTEDIMNIPGIKQGVYDKIKDHISV